MEVHLSHGRDLRQMADTKHLTPFCELAQELGHGLRGLTAHASVYFVEHGAEDGIRVLIGRLDREEEAALLSAAGDVFQGVKALSRVGLRV